MPEEAGFAESTTGKIVIPAIGAFISGLIGVAIGATFATTVPPIAKITPPIVDIKAGDIVQFDASGSLDPEGGELRYTWKVGGVSPEESAISTCEKINNNQSLSCRFFLPGTFAVSVNVFSDESELSSTNSSSVTTEIVGGYVGLAFPSLSADDSDEIYREILYGIDWPEIQETISKPIVLYNPDTGLNVYAVSFEGIEAHKSVKRPTGALNGIKIIIPYFRNDREKKLATSLTSLGASIVPLPANDVNPALSSGIADGGITALSSPRNSLNN